MNFNIYVNPKTGKRIANAAKALHRSRNSIINEAMEEWLKNHTKREWPAHFFDFEACEDVPDFKALRKELKKPKDDPLR